MFYILFQFFSNLQLAHFQEYTHIQNVSIFISLYIYYCICNGADTRRVLSQKWNEKINVSGQLLRILSQEKHYHHNAIAPRLFCHGEIRRQKNVTVNLFMFLYSTFHFKNYMFFFLFWHFTLDSTENMFLKIGMFFKHKNIKVLCLSRQMLLLSLVIWYKNIIKK